MVLQLLLFRMLRHLITNAFDLCGYELKSLQEHNLRPSKP